MSGLGGEVGELEDLLISMLEAQRDKSARQDAERTKRAAVEKRKDDIDRQLIASALHWQSGTD